MQLQLAIGGNGTLHVRIGHIDRLGIALAQNASDILLQPDIKREADILASARLKVTKHADRPATGIDLDTFIAGAAAQGRFLRVFYPDFARRQIRQVRKRPVFFNLALGHWRDISGDMRRQRALRIDATQRFLKPDTRQIGRTDGEACQLTLCQALADQDRPKGWLLTCLLQHLGNHLVTQLDNGAKLRQCHLQIAGIKRCNLQSVGFSIAGQQPVGAIDQPPAFRGDNPLVKLVTVRQTLIAVTLCHLQLVQPSGQETGDKHHAGGKHHRAPPDDPPVFLLLDLFIHHNVRSFCTAFDIVDRIT